MSSPFQATLYFIYCTQPFRRRATTKSQLRVLWFSHQCLEETTDVLAR